MTDWRSPLHADPLPWLLADETPAVRHLALRDLLDRPAGAPDRTAAQDAAMRADPIAAILAAESAEGWWSGAGPGYLPKYTATTWQVSFLEQMGADPAAPGVRAACEYVLGHTQTPVGAFGALTRATNNIPPPSTALTCLNGNVLRALIGFGRLDDERVQRSIEWQACAITGEGGLRYRGYTTGPLFRCGANGGEPCAWGATKAVLALGRIPLDRRSPAVTRALAAGVEFLLSVDPATAAYPTASGGKPSGSWFKLAFPLGYVSDVLQVLEAVVAAGGAADPRLGSAVTWLLSRQDADGRWPNEYTYAGKMIVDVDRKGRPSKWVTLRACRVLKAVAEA